MREREFRVMCVLLLFLLLDKGMCYSVDTDSLLDGRNLTLKTSEDISFYLEGEDYALKLDSFDGEAAKLSLSKNDSFDETAVVRVGESVNLSVDNNKLEVVFLDVGVTEISLNLRLHYFSASSSSSEYEKKRLGLENGVNEETSYETSLMEKIQKNPHYFFIPLLVLILIFSILVFWKLRKISQKKEVYEKEAYLSDLGNRQKWWA